MKKEQLEGTVGADARERIGALEEILGEKPATGLVNDAIVFCRNAVKWLRRFASMIDKAQERLPGDRMLFAGADEKRTVCDTVHAFLEACEVLDFQALTATFLAFDKRLPAVQAVLDRAAVILDELRGVRDESAPPSVKRLQKRLDKERAAFRNSVDICKSLRDPLVSFSFSIFPDFCARVDQNVDFDGDGAGGNPNAVQRSFVEMRAATDRLISILLKEVSF